MIVAGDADAPAVAEVVDVVSRPAGPVVHLRLLPGAVEDYEAPEVTVSFWHATGTDRPWNRLSTR